MINTTNLAADWVHPVTLDDAFQVFRLVVPYQFLTFFLAVDSVALLLWHLRHLGLFAVFYSFANPIYGSIGDREALYSVGSLIFSFIMFCMTLYHLSDPPGMSFNTRDIIHYSFPALIFSVPVLLVLDVGMRLCLSRTLTGSLRASVVNTMLMVNCLCTQYSYCLSSTPGRAVTRVAMELKSEMTREAVAHNISASVMGLMAGVEEGMRAVVGKGSPYCNMLDEPRHLPIAIVLTFSVIVLWSCFFNRFFRHGIILITPVRNRQTLVADSSVAAGLGLQSAEKRELEMRQLLEESASMSSWYTTNLVYTFSFMFVQLKIFLGRFDVRTMRAALAGVDRVEAAEFATPFRGKQELWFDFVADTGDGFDSTYSVARSIGQPSLQVGEPCPRKKKLRQKVHSILHGAAGRRSRSAQRPISSQPSSPTSSYKPNVEALPRGELLLHGGDLAYPHPTLDIYEKKLIRPYEAALAPPPGADLIKVGSKSCSSSSLLAKKYSAPLCWMIPGNHDWFDGLETFLHTICGRHWFGGWHLPQTNTYWALELPKDWFVLGFDLGLNDDLDDLQFAYFNNIVSKLPMHANVICITHGPYWYLDAYYKRESSRMYRHILTLLGSKLRVLLAGDVHHYSRYSPKMLREGPELIISGGGGAFLHPTHLHVEVAGYVRSATYPPEVKSRALALTNPFQFRRRNWAFEVLLGVLMVLMVVPALPLCGEAEAAYDSWSDKSSVLGAWCSLVMQCYWRILQTTYVALIAQIAVIYFMWSFAEAQWGSIRQLMWGLPFGFALSFCTVGIACSIEMALMAIGVDGHQKIRGGNAEPPAILMNLPAPWSGLGTWSLRSLLVVGDLPTHIYNARAAVCDAEGEAPRSFYLLYVLLMLPYFWIVVTPLGTFIFGCYLALASLWGRHMDEAFSSLRISNYKNFLRMHIDTSGDLHVYAIGIDAVPRKWAEDPLWRQEVTTGPTRCPAQCSAPSRWMPVPGVKCKLVDYVQVFTRRGEIKEEPGSRVVRQQTG